MERRAAWNGEMGGRAEGRKEVKIEDKSKQSREEGKWKAIERNRVREINTGEEKLCGEERSEIIERVKEEGKERYNRARNGELRRVKEFEEGMNGRKKG